MRRLIVLTTVFAMFAPFNASFAKTSQIQKIAVIEDIPEFLSTESNVATLYKTPVGCKLDFVMYGEMGKWQEVYQFKNNTLISAYTVQTDYKNGGLTNANNKTIKVAKQFKKVLNVKQHQTISNFNNLQAKFPKAKLTLCQS